MEMDLIDKEELTEIQSLLPDYTQKTVVLLGLGGGYRQLTAIFAQKANKVILYVCGEEIIEETKILNKDYANVEHIVVTDFQDISCPDSSVDLLFSNCLFNDIGDLLEKQLSWLKPGGHLFLRDCYAASLDERVQEASASTERNFQKYETKISSLLDHNDCGFDVVFFKRGNACLKVKSDKTSVFILLQKTESDGSNKGVVGFDRSDDYTMSRILFYEKVFGYNFLSLGGEEITKEMVSLLDLKPRQKVLDVGGGTGGSAFYLVKNCDVSVISVDISPNMALIGCERAREAGIGPDQIVFETADATQMDYPPESFDAVYSLATLFYIEDKVSLLKRLHKFLKPGGRLIISDYCHSNVGLSECFQCFVKEHQYELISPKEYYKILSEDAGFVNAKVLDRTHQFRLILQERAINLEELQAELMQEFGTTNYNWLSNRWKALKGHLNNGDLEWGCFYADKSK